MTYKDFKRQLFTISQEPFRGLTLDPLDLGIERTRFEEAQIIRMIALGRKAKFETVKRRVEAWNRKLERVRARRQQLENTKAGIFCHNPQPTAKQFEPALT